MMRLPFVCLALSLSVPLACLGNDPVERASFNSAGGLTSLITNGRELPFEAFLEVAYPGGVARSLQPHDQSTPVTRDGLETKWTGTVSFPNGNQMRMEAAWKDAGDGLRFDGVVIAGGAHAPNAWVRNHPLRTELVSYVIDLPRETFEGWTFDLTHSPLPRVVGSKPDFYAGRAAGFTLTDPSGNWHVKASWDKEREVEARQVWNREKRVYQVRIVLSRGERKWDERTPFTLSFSLAGQGQAEAVALAPAAGSAPYPFDGFGGNLCFDTQTPAIEYILDRLPMAWGRVELKAGAWISERENPGPALKRDFELMQRLEKAGIPWALSIWRLPETYYTDANRVPPGTFGRRISEEKWPDFLETIISFILYAKKHYGAEPDFFSFNEPDLGVDIGFTAETHRDAIKRIGRHFLANGIATKQLLGDTANPRDTHLYTLPTAQDPEAMQHVGAISFHSWFAASPAQYRAWSEVANWIQKPLIVGEAGLDPGAYRNKSFDSYSYGIREMAHMIEILRDTTPRSLLYWQYTEDYGLVRVDDQGNVSPTGRFRLMEQLVARTPLGAKAMPLTTSQKDVLAVAFEKDGAKVLHILNRGLARSCDLGSLLSGAVTRHITTETSSGHDEASLSPGESVELPARSLVTFVTRSR
ncbi:MAG: hypothetical protein SFV32_00350 [Opitutaceae bacterium]|nr:hypothetical protein [Opitutaceae bacterium]